MLHIVRILAIIFGILLLLAGIAYAAFVAWAFSVCGTFAGYACGGSLGFLLVGPILIIIFGVVDFIIYMQMKEIEALFNQRKYEQAKAKTLIWMILGFILGGLILGILLLIAYLKFDPLINWQRSGGGGAPPAYGAAPPAPGMAPQVPAPMAPPPPQAAPAMAPAPRCTNCGQPTTYIAQYGRYYCYACSRYA